MNEALKPRIVGDSKFRRDAEKHRKLGANNCFGLVVQHTVGVGDVPVICGCGGSGYLCPEHATRMLTDTV